MMGIDNKCRRIAVVIPAFNEQEAIGEIVRKVSVLANAIVVDDGSHDGTAEVALAAGAEVVSHKTNQGYDHALETGMRRALALGFDAAITMDADGQHQPETLLAFIEALQNGAELVVGIRDRRQRISETVFAGCGSLLWGIKDPLCGMKGYQLSLLQKAGRFDTYSSIGTELAIRAAKSGCSVSQVQVPTQARNGVSRFGGGWRPNYWIIRALVLGVFNAPKFN